jgi:hypothetical protein
MSSGTLYLVAVVRTDISGNITPPSSGFLRVRGLHSCVTVESLLINLSTKGYYVGSKNILFWGDGGGMFSKTLVLTTATWYQVPEDIYN